MNVHDFDAIGLSLIIRAVIMAILFVACGWFALKTNYEDRTAVRVLGWMMLILGIFNIVMAIEWTILFY